MYIKWKIFVPNKYYWKGESDSGMSSKGKDGMLIDKGCSITNSVGKDFGKIEVRIYRVS